jgi:hypothetical protein
MSIVVEQNENPDVVADATRSQSDSSTLFLEFIRQQEEEKQGKLFRIDNDYHVTCKSRFEPLWGASSEDVGKVLDFAWAMNFDGDGAHRPNRSGGDKKRTLCEMFADDFQGKLAELSFYWLLLSHGVSCSSPDMGVYPRWKWDSGDINANSKDINIKSVKWFSNLMLLETENWDAECRYIPDLNLGKKASYDWFVLLRISPAVIELMKSNGWTSDTPPDKAKLFGKFLEQKWKMDVGGAVPSSRVEEAIATKAILPKGAMLNGSILMDAENYYIQSGKMGDFENFLKAIKT